MKVCHLTTSSTDDRFFRNIAVGLSRRGLAVSVGSLCEQREPGWRREAPEVDYFCLASLRRRQYSRAILSLARYLRAQRVDVVQTHLFDAGAVGLAASRLARTKAVIHTRHHLDEHFLIGTRAHVALDRLMIRGSDMAVVVSEAARDHLIRRESIDPAMIEVINIGWDFESLRATPEDGRRVRAELGLESGFVIGYVARFIPFKGHDVLLAAVERLRSRIPNVRVLFVGDGPRERLERLTEDLGLTDHVVFAGFRRDVMACMRAMDVLVHPSRTESFPQVIVEALAAETPVVATRVGGVSEIVEPERTGLLVPPGRPEAIEAAVLRLYENPELRIAFGRRGRISVSERFTLDRMLDRMVESYERCLSAA
jgi:glycosyltransferase involved in cell wall biosynthesis